MIEQQIEKEKNDDQSATKVHLSNIAVEEDVAGPAEEGHEEEVGGDRPQEHQEDSLQDPRQDPRQVQKQGQAKTQVRYKSTYLSVI